MPYGTIKVDTITFTDGGIDKSVSISGLVQNPTFTGNVTVTGTVSGATVRATTISGVTISGTTINAASGVFTTQISGAVVVAPAGLVGTPSVQVGTGATVAPGLYGAGTDQLGVSTGGSSRLVVDSVGQIRVVTLGSAAAPALVVGNDLNTGLYSPGADLVAISTAGTGRLFVDDSGNVGIGSAPSTTTGRLLDINGVLLQPAFQLRATSATAAYTTYTLDTVNSLVTFVSSDWPVRYFINGTERLRITSDGKVGIGTSSPEARLSIVPSALDTPALILPQAPSAAANNYVSIRSKYDVGNEFCRSEIRFGVESTGGGSGFLQLATGTNTATPRLHINANGLVGIGTSSPGNALHVNGSIQTNSTSHVIYSNNFGNYSSASDLSLIAGSASLLFKTGAANDERARITSDGKVGIGTSSPNRLFESSAATVDNFARINTTGATKSGIEFANGGTVYSQLYFNNVAPYDLSLFQQYSTGSLIFGTNSTERLRIDSSGRLLVGTSSSTAEARFIVQGGTTASGGAMNIQRSLTTASAGSTIGYINFTNSTNNVGATISANGDGTWSAGTSHPTNLTFSTTADGASTPTERMRLDNKGTFSVFSSTANVIGAASNQAAGTTYYLFYGANNSSSTTTGTTCFLVYTNGNVQNTNNSYAGISDAKLKENIVDATSQWSDIKALQVRKYNFKEGQTHTQIGLVAQEVELVSPGLVTESPDRDEEGNDLGTVTKSVNYSVLYMKAVKALQEAMERIETLEAKVAALESK